MPIKVLSEIQIPLGPSVKRMEEFKEAVEAIEGKDVPSGKAIEITLPRAVPNKKALIVSFIRTMKRYLRDHKLEQYRIATRDERIYITNAGRKHGSEVKA